MKQLLLITFCFAIAATIKGQTTAGFEEFQLEVDEFLDGSDLSGGFSSGHIYTPNDYNETYFSWTGWAISATTDTVTPGFTNQYSAIPGHGAEGTDAYAVNYSFGPNVIRLDEDARGAKVNGMYITNNTYSYLSMRDGDAFAKKFGGETGDDPDFYLLTIKAYTNDVLFNDSINFYLADYRFDDNQEDYLVNSWKWVDLTSLGNCDSLYLNLTSSDNGQFGMNTPSYYCIDNVTTEDVSSSIALMNPDLEFTIYPNPTSDFVQFNWTHGDAEMYLIDPNGRVILEHDLYTGTHNIGLTALPAGVYRLHVRSDEGVYTKSLVKQ